MIKNMISLGPGLTLTVAAANAAISPIKFVSSGVVTMKNANMRTKSTCAFTVFDDMSENGLRAK